MNEAQRRVLFVGLRFAALASLIGVVLVAPGCDRLQSQSPVYELESDFAQGILRVRRVNRLTGEVCVTRWKSEMVQPFFNECGGLEERSYGPETAGE
jgi:hypothetical protein